MTCAAQILDALGDPTRRRIFELLADEPSSVAHLAARLPVSRPAVSQHLRVLKEAHLVNDRAEGTKRVYSVHAAGLADLYRYLDRFWDDALVRFKLAAEAEAQKARRGQP